MTEKKDLSNTQLINVKKSLAGTSTTASDITNNLIKENTNENIRKDFFNKAIVKKGKNHKVTWIDKTKKVQLTNIEDIESYKSYNLSIVQAQGNIINNQCSANKDKEEEESVRCQCLIL